MPIMNGEADMKILKIKDNNGYFYCVEENDWKPIDEIDKDGLMGLLNVFIESEVSMDDYDDSQVRNQAHQIIYKSIYEKFNSLKENKSKFKDESDRLYMEALQKYKVSEATSD